MKKKRKHKPLDETPEKLPDQIEINFDPNDIEADFDLIEKLCYIQSTIAEIRAKTGCSEQTLDKQCEQQFGKPFLDYHTEKRALGRLLLRQKLFETAYEGGNKGKAKGHFYGIKFLAINYLGLSDSPVNTDEKNESKLLADAVDEIILKVNKKTDAS
jgi:AraC-like DNA-binding protein